MGDERETRRRTAWHSEDSGTNWNGKKWTTGPFKASVRQWRRLKPSWPWGTPPGGPGFPTNGGRPSIFGNVSFKDALVNKGPSSTLRLHEVSGLTKSWRHQSLIGDVVDLDVLGNLMNRLAGLVEFGVELRCLWGLKVLLTFNSSVALRKFIQDKKKYPIWIQETSKCWAPDFIENPMIPPSPSPSPQASSEMSPECTPQPEEGGC
ncbi:hypothetical protein L1987_79677 [Smallanthus sonchifolius]|uniref:Uncharacterized protein n=1 Tax=Smallanthus sonchifolius TaxID=185202 RepID=A0ACB8YKR3_9ASTR|nr:hypothetical protein L1987_79677 [Smallanthus sonchifolius]